MKKIKLLFVGVLVSTFTMAGHHTDDPEANSNMTVVKRDESSFNLIYKSDHKANVKIQIFNERNTLVFSEVIGKSDGFIRPYNFMGLKEGQYTIQLDNGSNTIKKTVRYSNEDPEKLAQLIHMNNGKYLLTVAGLGLDEISVKIRSKMGQIVYSERFAVDGNFAKVYDLAVLKDDFAFEINDSKGVSKTLWP